MTEGQVFVEFMPCLMGTCLWENDVKTVSSIPKIQWYRKFNHTRCCVVLIVVSYSLSWLMTVHPLYYKWSTRKMSRIKFCRITSLFGMFLGTNIKILWEPGGQWEKHLDNMHGNGSHMDAMPSWMLFYCLIVCSIFIEHTKLSFQFQWHIHADFNAH